MFRVFVYVALFAVLLAALVIAIMWFNRAPLLKRPGPVARIGTYLSNNVAETRHDHRFPELVTPVFDVAPSTLHEAVIEAMRQLGWHIASKDGDEYAVHAVATTPLWRFEDDVHVNVEVGEQGSSHLQIRSASRLGRGDLAANTRHIRDLIDAVRRQLPAP